MRAVLKWGFRLILMAALAAVVVGLWKRDEITRLWIVNTLFDQQRIVANFSNMDRAFLTVPVSRGDGPVSPLPKGSAMTLPNGAKDWIAERDLTSLLVLHDGKIMHESYHKGTRPDDLRISWSMAKSYLSVLFGILFEEGAISSLDAPVLRYAPQLAGSAYDGATIRHILQMTSGVEFDEDYLDYDSDINRMGRVLALGGSMDEFTAGLATRAAQPGATWKYVSIDTHVLGMIIRGATGRDIPDLMSEKVITPLGLEATPYYLTDRSGVSFVLGGLNMRTRDYARFGLMVEQMGVYQGRQVVPSEWIAASTAASAPTSPNQLGYGFQWWIPMDAPEGEFMARGIYGQYIYINQSRDVVIVVTSADRQFREPGADAQNVIMMRRIADAL